MFSFIKSFILFVFRPQWVAFNADGEAKNEMEWELGLKIWGIIFSLWKNDVLIYRANCPFRKISKREFGECIHTSEFIIERYEGRVVSK